MLQTINAGARVEAQGPSYTDAGNGNWEQACGGRGQAPQRENENEIRLLPDTIHKINCKQIKDLNERTDTMKLKTKSEHTLT